MKYKYEEVIHTIENTRRFGKMTGYEVSKSMLEQLGNPQSGIPFVHVAGTNGKGSTTAFLCKILEQTGKKIGMFTSPHLITFEERIRINGEYISKEDVTRLGNFLLEQNFDVSPTMFDYCLAMAVLYFKEQQCDLMVMETGIGGRFDSTNALGIPEVAIITKIGMDHMAILGNTLEEIAGEKAGIMKPGGAVVTTAQQEPARLVLLDNFAKVNPDATEKEFIHTKQQWEENPGALEVVDGAGIYEVSRQDFLMNHDVNLKMIGGYQIENAGVATLAARILFAKLPELFLNKGSQMNHVSEEQVWTYIKAGLSKTFWKGRMEIVNEHPFFMIDGAHNPDGVWALASGLRDLYPDEKFHFIMGVMADKDYEDMIDILLPLAYDFVTVTPESSRALQSKDLATCIERKGVKATFAEDMESVILPLLAEGETTNPEKTIAFGSLYFIGAIEAMLEKNKGNE